MRSLFAPLAIGGQISRSSAADGSSPAVNGASFWWSVLQPDTELDGSEIVTIKERITGNSANDLLSDPSLGGTYDASLGAVYNGTTQYHRTTAAGVLALATGNDSVFTLIVRGALTGGQANGRAAGFSRNSAARHAGFGNDTAGTGYRLQRTSTATDVAIAHVTTEQIWCARFRAGGLTNDLQYGATTVVGPVDQSAAAADPYTDFVVAARTATGPIVNNFLACSIKDIALWNRDMTDQEYASLRAYWGL
jgi:hypothetical protein